MVDSRAQAEESEYPGRGGGGIFAPLVKARFIVVAAVVAASLGLGFAGSGGEEPRKSVAAEMPGLHLDPNTVPPQVLTALPHVGSALVERWVQAREERPFRSLEDAGARVRGLGAATLEQLAPYFDVPAGSPQNVKLTVSQNTSRPRAKRGTAVRKNSGSKKAAATQQPHLAASQ